MMQDTWTFPVEAAGPLLAWLHEILPGWTGPWSPWSPPPGCPMCLSVLAW